jgi:hypothetical protein
MEFGFGPVDYINNTISSEDGPRQTKGSEPAATFDADRRLVFSPDRRDLNQETIQASKVTQNAR